MPKAKSGCRPPVRFQVDLGEDLGIEQRADAVSGFELSIPKRAAERIQRRGRAGKLFAARS